MEGHSGVRPVNRPQRWSNWSQIGTQYEAQPDRDEPMLGYQLDYLRQHMKDRFENLEFADKLGQGAFGMVFKVIANRPGDKKRFTMACKIIRLLPSGYGPDKGSLKKSVETLLTEVKALRFVNHRNVMNFMHSITIPDTETGFPYALLCLFMDLCDGDLYRLISQQPGMKLSEQSTRIWFRQISRAVHYLHRRNIVHLDIKPKNILHKYYGQKKPNSVEEQVVNSVFQLTDFGEAECHSKDTKPTELSYLKSTDIYGLGSCLIQSIHLDNSLDSKVKYEDWIQKYRLSSLLADLVFRLSADKTDDIPTISEVLSHQWTTNDDSDKPDSRRTISMPEHGWEHSMI